jgi:hypothetical protein
MNHTGPELRVNLGYGYLRYRIPSKNDAIRILVLLRRCNCGLYYNMNDSNPIITMRYIQQYNEVKKILDAL